MKYTKRLTNLFYAAIFLLAAASAGAGQTSFSNTAPITIPSSGTATPYPSNINVSGLSGTTVKATVTLSGFNHTYPSDFGVLLVSPTGASVNLMLSLIHISEPTRPY